MAITENSYEGYLSKVRSSESGGKANAKNPRSSASGLYQFTKGTWEGLGYDWNDRFNTGLQNQAMAKLTNSNSKYLRSKLGVNPTDADLYGAHFLGPVRYKSVYQASSDSPLSSVLTGQEISANPFLKGKTVGFLKNWLSKKMGKDISTQEVEGETYSEPWNYNVNTDVNLLTNTGEYTTAPEYQEPAKDTEVQVAKEQLLQKQNEKDFLAEVQSRQQQQEQVQQQQDPGIDQSYYQIPGIALPEYQQIAAEQAQSQAQFKFKDGGQTDDDREMVEGIADILSQVKDPKNRAQIAEQMVTDFKNQDVMFDYENFMEMSRLQNGGEINENGLVYAQDGTTFFPQVSAPFGLGNAQSPFIAQPAQKTAAVNTAPTNKPAPKVSAKPSKYEYLFETDNSKKLDTRDIVMPKFNGIKEGSGNPSQVILNQQQEQSKKVFKEEFRKQEESKSVKELNDLRKEVNSKSILEDSIENNEVSLDMNNYRTEKDVAKLQKMLTDKGYNLNPQGKFTNNGIDGKLGKVTLNAMVRYNQHNSDSGYASIKEGTGFIGNCQEGQCSEYMQNEIFRNVQPNLTREDWNKKTGLYGNAWDIGNNIVKSGGSKVAPKAVKSGDVVTMFTGGRSQYQGEANAAGTGTTHTGLIDKVNPDGSYYILHNVHSKNRWTGEFEGKEFRDLVKDGKIVSGGLERSFKVRNAFRPDYKEVKLGENKILRNDLNLTIDPKKASLLSSKEYDNNFTSANAKNKLEKTFIKPLNDTRNRSVMAKVFNLGDDEYQSLAKVTLGILGQESSFGTNAKYTTGYKQTGATVSKLAGYFPPAVGVNELVKASVGKDLIKKDEVSKGAGRLKYETNFGADDLTELGITEDNFDDEDKAPLTTMYKLATDYKKFLNKGYNKKDAMYRAITVYNVSLNKVSQGKKIEDWAKSYDVDYTNKVLNYSSMFNVNDGKKSYKTATDELLLQPNVYKWRERLKKENKL